MKHGRHFAWALGLTLIHGAWAADTGQLPCRNTQECRANAAQLGVASADAGTYTSAADRQQDTFYWLNQINKASAVMLVEAHIFPPETGRVMARGVAYALAQAQTPEGRRPSDVLQLERIMTDQVGPEASVIHAGRSRQDMYATFRAAQLRNQTLDFAEALLGLRERLLARAADHIDTLMPAYTNGVQAVPVTYAHYLLGYESAFGRDQRRLVEAYARLNLSPMGSGVLSGSIWPLDRARLGALLGFDGVVDNTYDANQIIPVDTQLEVSSLAASTATHVGTLMQDLHIQYHQVRPWLLLQEGSTYTSSSMPQKRNPGLITQARMQASDVVGLAQAVDIRFHNVSTGMVDYKSAVGELGVLPKAVDMVKATDRVFDALVVDRDRALEELRSDWTSTMNLAEWLLQAHQIPFRVGHGFASELVSYARPRGLTPDTIPFTVVADTFAQTLARFKLPARAVPMTEAEFRELMSPGWIVAHTQGQGGPQAQETRRMLGLARQQLAEDRAWLAQRRSRLAQADQELDTAFAHLLPPEGR
ncbi:MAG: argininosuccinate lyase [Curvibacter sp.]|nr:argininosuccinate lyase [Curvibacter sp.]